jgi:hypothetical protein
MKGATLGSKDRVSLGNADQTVLAGSCGRPPRGIGRRRGRRHPPEGQGAFDTAPLRPRDPSLEKHSSEARYALHGLISFFVNELTDLGKYCRAARKPFRGLLRTKPLMKLNF